MSLTPEQRGNVTLITGVIGADTHIVGNRILSMALEKEGETLEEDSEWETEFPCGPDYLMHPDAETGHAYMDMEGGD